MSTRRRYEVLETIGQGGMGTVYRARLRSAGDFEKDVAVKVLNDGGVDGAEGEDIARRLRDEARILGLIRHRAVVHVDGLVRVGGRWAVVMEYIDGLDLGKILKLWGAMPVACALEVLQECAGALHVAYHAPGPDGRPLRLLHRDIKPQNITVTVAGEVKVLDFGVAKGDFDTREAETRHASFGSMGYVPQERIDGIDGPEGDVFSLGVCFYEMLVGERWDKTLLSRSRHDKLLHERVEKLVDRGVPKQARQLLWNMMQFEPEDRPSARDVERFVTRIRGEAGGVPLRDWTERNLPVLIEQVRSSFPSTGLTGQILEETGSEAGDAPRPVPASDQEVEPEADGSGVVLRGLALVLALGVVLVGFIAMGAVGFLVGQMI